MIRDSIRLFTNMDIADFAEEKLSTSYASFYYRIKHKGLKVHEYHVLNLYTGLTFEQIWPNPHTRIPEKVKLNLAPLKHPLNIVPVEINQPMPNIHRISFEDEVEFPIPLNAEDEMLKIAERMAARKIPNDGPLVEDISSFDSNPEKSQKNPQGINPAGDFDDPYGGSIPVDD